MLTHINHQILRYLVAWDLDANEASPITCIDKSSDWHTIDDLDEGPRCLILYELISCFSSKLLLLSLRHDFSTPEKMLIFLHEFLDLLLRCNFELD